ncbi:hypothetical protein BH11ACT1_BH11ACT1_13080 [soil metagenome]
MSTGVLARSLGDTRDASILIPGDAAAVRADARALDETAETLTTVADGVGSAAARGWTGKAASTFSETTAAMRTSILVAANAMGSAASALHAHASTLEWAQDQARAAIRSFDAAAACVAPDLLGAITPTAGQHLALATLADARSLVRRSASNAAAALQDACVDAPIGPGLWNQVGYQWSELWHGAAESFSGLGHLAWDHSTVRRQLDPDGTTASDTALAIGLVAAVKDPVQLGKDVIDYDTWATSPARAIGHLAPDAAVAALTAGGGLVATRGASTGAHVIAEAASVSDEAAAISSRVRQEAGAVSAAESTGLESAKPAAGLVRPADAEASTPFSIHEPTNLLDRLTPEQSTNLARYRKKLPVGAEETSVTRREGGGLQFSTNVPGRVRGSYAIYTKTIDAAGITIRYTKTTIAPDGEIVHTKVKLGS